MSRLLYVNCNLRPADRSHSLSVGKEFLDECIGLEPDK